MPPIFKALASISAWALFIFGWVNILGGVWGYVQQGPLGLTRVTSSVLDVWALGAACLILSVVAMKLRQMLE